MARAGRAGLGRSSGQFWQVVQVHLAPQQPVDQEAEGQEAGAEQVPQPREVGDAVVVRIQGLVPRQPDHHLSQVQQDGHLSQEPANTRRD